MPFLSAGELLQAVIDACRHRTEAVLYLDGRNPFSLSIDGRSITLFVANVSHTRRRDPDEYRIQCPGGLPEELAMHKANGQEVCILGYSSDSDTFSAWDPNMFVRRSQRTQRFSLYTRLTNHERASSNGFAIYRDSAGQNVLSFRSEFLGLYVANTELMHRATERALHRIVCVHRASRSGAISRSFVTVARRLCHCCKTIDVTQSQYARSPQFRQAVLEAYENCCAMCGLQLELIEAAHLVPHAHPNGLDIVPNGIALCALHHKSLDTGLLYLDTGLLYIDANYCIHINAVRQRYLARMRRTGGFRRFRRQLRPMITLPQDPNEFPLRENITLGNQLRGIEVD